MTNPANNMYCLVSFKGPDIQPEILEVQGVVWFADEDLAWQYYMWLSEAYRSKHGSVYTVKEDSLCYHFHEGSDYIKQMKTRTRLTSNAPEPGVNVSNIPTKH